MYPKNMIHPNKGMLFNLKKWNFVTDGNMNEHERDCIKWSKSGMKDKHSKISVADSKIVTNN